MQLCLAVKFAHENQIVHRDIKSSNIFIAEKDVLKLADFGMALNIEKEEEKVHSSVGTPLYMAPEILENKGHSFKADVWSLACVAYEILAKQPPFFDRSYAVLIDKILFGEIPALPSHYSPELREFVTSLLVRDAEKRPSMQEIFQRDFIKKLFEEFEDEACTFLSVNTVDNLRLNEKGLRKDFSSLKTYRFSEFKDSFSLSNLDAKRRQSNFRRGSHSSETSNSNQLNESMVDSVSAFTKKINTMIDDKKSQPKFFSDHKPAKIPRRNQSLSSESLETSPEKHQPDPPLEESHAFRAPPKKSKFVKRSINIHISLSELKISQFDSFSRPNQEESEGTVGCPEARDSMGFMDNYFSKALASTSPFQKKISQDYRAEEAMKRGSSLFFANYARGSVEPLVADPPAEVLSPQAAHNFRSKLQKVKPVAKKPLSLQKRMPVKVFVGESLVPLATKKTQGNPSPSDLKQPSPVAVNINMKGRAEGPQTPAKQLNMTVKPCVPGSIDRSKPTSNQNFTDSKKKRDKENLFDEYSASKPRREPPKPNLSVSSKDKKAGQATAPGVLKDQLSSIFGNRFSMVLSKAKKLVLNAGLREVEDSLKEDSKLLSLFKRFNTPMIKDVDSLDQARQILKLSMLEIKSEVL